MSGFRRHRRPGAGGACAASTRLQPHPASQSWAGMTAARRPRLPRTAAATALPRRASPLHLVTVHGPRFYDCSDLGMYNSSGVQALVCLAWRLGSSMLSIMLDKTSCANSTLQPLVQKVR